MEYRWKIIDTTYEETTGRIASVMWTCDRDGEKTQGVTKIQNPTGQMIPYADVTEEDILSWIFSYDNLGLLGKGGVEQFVDALVSNKTTHGTPWSPQEGD